MEIHEKTFIEAIQDAKLARLRREIEEAQKVEENLQKQYRKLTGRYFVPNLSFS